MRILQVINSARPEGGGPIESIIQAHRALAPRGHQLEMVSLDSPDVAWLKQFEFPVHAIGPARTSFRYSPRLVPWLRKNASRFDCAIVNGIWLFPTLATWLAYRQTGFPYFIYTHGMMDPTLKQVFPLRHGKKHLYWKLVEHKVVREARGVFFTCREEETLAAESFTPYTVNGQIVPYCVGEPPGSEQKQTATFLSRFPQLRDKRRILFLSRLNRKKGCDVALEAFAAVFKDQTPFHLVMAGPDESNWQSQLEARASDLGVSGRVTWTGMLTGDLKWGAFRSAEVFLLPSHQENFGIAVVEALACGTPVLITRRINIWREIEADGAGFTQEDTLEGATKLLVDWRMKPTMETDRLRQKARDCFVNRFRSAEAVDNLLNTLRVNGVKEREKIRIDPHNMPSILYAKARKPSDSTNH